MSIILRASKGSRRNSPGTAKPKVSKVVKHSTPGLTGLRASKASQRSTSAASKPRSTSKRYLEAKDGNLFSMVKVGWGLGRMLTTYNVKQIEKGLPILEQIEDTHLLQLVEARKVTQRNNTQKYQARNSALASLGDLRAARKLKWSVPRMKALELWVRNGSVGLFEETCKQEESSDCEELEDLVASESQSDADPESEPELEVEMEENIQVAGPPVSPWTGKMALMPAHAAIPMDHIETTSAFGRAQSSGKEMWDFPDEVVFNSPNRSSSTAGTNFGTSTSSGSSIQFGLGLFDSGTRSSSFAWDQTDVAFGDQHTETSMSYSDNTDNYLRGHSMRNYADYGFPAQPVHSRSSDTFKGAHLSNENYDVQQQTYNMQYEAKAAAKGLQLAQNRVYQANQDLFDAQVRESAGIQDTYFNGQHTWLEPFR